MTGFLCLGADGFFGKHTGKAGVAVERGRPSGRYWRLSRQIEADEPVAGVGGTAGMFRRNSLDVQNFQAVPMLVSGWMPTCIGTDAGLYRATPLLPGE